MKYLKKFEDKRFTDWLKDPKKPKIKKFEYVFKKRLSVKTTLVDNGELTTGEMLDFIKYEYSTDLWREIAQYCDVSVEELNNDDELLDSKFEEWCKEQYGKSYWGNFIDEYFTNDNDEIGEPSDYQKYVNICQSNIDQMDITQFGIYESWDIREGIIDNLKIKVLNYNNASNYENIYFGITCIELNKKEEEEIKSLINEMSDELSAQIRIEVRSNARRGYGISVKFDAEIEPIGKTVLEYKKEIKNKQ